METETMLVLTAPAVTESNEQNHERTLSLLDQILCSKTETTWL